MDDIVKDFLVESYENLDRMDRDFVELEKNPSKEILQNIFRAIHTIKGTCGFLGFGKLESVTHVGESLLSLLRDGALQASPAITDALLAMVDVVRLMLASIETTGDEGERDDSQLIERLSALQRGDGFQAVKSPKAAKSSSPPPKPELTAKDIDLSQATLDDLEKILEQRAKQTVQPVLPLPVTPAKASKPAKEKEAGPAHAESKGTVSDSTVRVDVGLLDNLMNLVGELVLSRNQILQFAAGQEDATFLATSQHLNLVTGELQEGVMKTRMQPIGMVWNKFPRVVRDLAASCKKQVRIEMEGAETELDRTIIEAIKDPLTHVVRNSVDHGIESPEARQEAGKAVEGVIFLRAYHEGGQVNIEISDDGGGISTEKVRDKALEKGLISAENAGRMSERELANLIFLPGFSTAEKVTNVSGRGVGMDVVKTNIEKIGGAVDVQTRLGRGTTLKIKIPLTLAIVPALMVTTGGDRYAIPQVSLLELVRLDGANAGKGVEMVHGAPVYRLRGTLLPLVYLNRVLRLPSADESNQDRSVNIVVLQSDGHPFGLVVDGINDSKDIVVKPLGKHLTGLSVFSGATILGDGKVALILDVVGISQSANFVVEGREPGGNESHAAVAQQSGEFESLLVFRQGDDDRLAIPLNRVARLEVFKVESIEHSGPRRVIQYRGEIMPLIQLSDYLSNRANENAERDEVQVVVCHRGNSSVGLIVGQIVDIVEDRVVIDRSGGTGLLGAAVVQGRVTDLVDVTGIIEAAGLWPEGSAQAA